MNARTASHTVIAAGATGECWLREPQGDDACVIARWFADPAISRWFDFGLGRQRLDSRTVQAMLQGGRHHLRVFGSGQEQMPCGLVAVSDITHAFATGSFWVLRDGLRQAYPGITRDAAVHILADVFTHYGLQSISAWAVQENTRSQRLLARIGFRVIGLQRCCHLLDGQPAGRILYDLLPGELRMEPVCRRL